MTSRDRLLMGPGPSNPYPEALAASAQPLLGHMDPAFLQMLDETNAQLRRVFGTSNEVTFPVSGTGSAGMEAVFANWVRAGDVVVVGVNGLFGERMCEVASRYGAEVVRVDHEWGQPLTAERILSAHPSPSLIAAVHAETSTGVRSDIETIGANKGDALLVMDCVTSIGGEPLEVDGWSVDVAYAGTQKCLGVPPGLAPLTASPRAMERRVERPTSWYLDIGLIAGYLNGNERAYHHTAPTSMVAALHGGLGRIHGEGLDNAFARHALCGGVLQEGLEELGFTLFASAGWRLAQLTTVRLPEGLDETMVRHALLNEFDIEIGNGVGQFAGRIWRIGCMGNTAQLRNVKAFLGALESLL